MQIFINKDRVILCNPVDDSDKFINLVIVDGDLHALSAEYIGRTHQHRIAQTVAPLPSPPPPVNTVPPAGLGILHLLQNLVETAPGPPHASTFSAVVPRIGTPIFIRLSVSLIAVCPPNCTTAPSGFSMSTMLSTSSGVSGSKYSLSAISKSVLTVSGLLLTMMVS